MVYVDPQLYEKKIIHILLDHWELIHGIMREIAQSMIDAISHLVVMLEFEVFPLGKSPATSCIHLLWVQAI